MKKTLPLLASLILTVSVFAQTPEGINYQAVIRDASSNILTNQTVGIQFKLLQGTPPVLTTIYTETHTTTTDNFGFITLVVGEGTTCDNFSTIDWSIGSYFLEIAADVSGGTSYSVLGTQQLMSVPYALYAKTSGSASPSSEITDADNNTKIQVEENANEDIIRFDMTGTEYFTMTNGRLNVLNTGMTIAIGNNAGSNDDFSNNENTFIGNEAGLFTTSGNKNVAIGSLVLEENVTGNNNTAIGAQALNNNISGSNNTALGFNANVLGGNISNATALGYQARVANSNSLVLGGIGANAVKVGIGTDSPTELLTLAGTSGTDGILFPDNTLQTTAFTGTVTVDEITDADNNTKIQVEKNPNEDIIRFDVAGTEQWKMTGTRLENLNSGRSIFIGQNAGLNDDLTNNDNVFVGFESGKANTTGSTNLGLGSYALTNNNGGSNNTALGSSASAQNTTGTSNVAIGKFALFDNQTGNNNVAIGADALEFGGSADANNVAVGFESGYNAQGSNNIFIGNRAGKNKAGNHRLFIDNTSTAPPLIYGEFDNDLLRVNGTLNINNAFSLPTTDGTANQVLKTDGAGNVTWQSNSGAIQNVITDADNNTKIQVEETVNDDTIRFDIAGTERLKIKQNINGVTMIEPNNNNGGVFLGVNAGSNATSGGANTFIGTGAGRSITNGSSNTFVGYGAGLDAVTGSRNVMLGSGTGSSSSGSDNVFIGNNAGSLESGSNKLYIENTNSSAPLIYGEFDNDLVKVNGDLEVTGQILLNGSSLLPVGSIQMYMGTTAPAGWLICDGATFSAATYPALNTLLGGNIVPDFSGRMPIGVGNNGTQGGINHALGGFGGEENHRLTVNELASHSHTTLITYREGSEQGSGNNYSDLGGTATTGTGYTSASTGGNQPHNNMSPYYVVNFIIKAN